jgi:wyosine [tRNA(Phe)-imidazoG37] synthetase (radical SAM superfamily)
MDKKINSLFYGPVASRRFGYSLGIDLIPYKVCSFNCIYCQLGKTTVKTIERKRYREINLHNFLAELEDIIKNAKRIDYITFSGSGEPTLNSDIGILINNVKKITDIPVAVLTNGSTLYKEDVVNDLRNADLIKVSLDACNERVFKKINRPYHTLVFNNIINGINLLSQSFNGRIWLEIMILKNVNDDLSASYEFRKILSQNNILDRIEKIHINTPVRPSGFKEVFIPSSGDIEILKNTLGKKAEIINQITENDFLSNYYKQNKEIYERIVELAKRRPATIKDFSHSLGMNINEIIKCIRLLLKDNKIKYKIYRNTRYYYC